MPRAANIVQPVVRFGLPTLFVMVWSSGFLVGGIATRTASATALGFWRFGIAALVLAVIAFASRAPWPKRPADWVHLAVTGTLLQTVQFVGSFAALQLGVAAGLTSLITSATPLVVAALAVPLFRERLQAVQIVGLGLGTAGVVASVGASLSGKSSLLGIVAAFVGLAGFAGGTLYQKRFGQEMDLRTGTSIQLGAATITIAPLTAITGGLAVPPTAIIIASVAWLALVSSIGAFLLLFVLLRRYPGADATSYLFLVPPITALLAIPILGESLSVGALAGIVLAGAGVALVTRRTGHPRAH